MKNLTMTFLIMLFSLAAFSQINLISKDSLYVHPQNLGQYPNATLEYVGEINNSYKKTFVFVFELRTENGELISQHKWSASGETNEGDFIKNDGWLKVIRETDTIQADFYSHLMAGGILSGKTIEVVEHPQLSYDDILTYFRLGTKLQKVRLPDNTTKVRKLTKWMLLNQLYINGEPAKKQFTF